MDMNLDMDGILLDYRLKGYCCSQIIAHMTLSKVGRDDPQLVAAMKGLCYGMGRERDCGTLSAAVCMMHMLIPEEAPALSDQLIDWFYESFGTIECCEILQGNPINKLEKCPAIVGNTARKLFELLEDEGVFDHMAIKGD